jgi:hypothetical protein
MICAAFSVCDHRRDARIVRRDYQPYFKRMTRPAFYHFVSVRLGQPLQGEPAVSIPMLRDQGDKMSNHSTLPPSSGEANYIFQRDGYAKAEIHSLTTSDVESAKVYGRNGETIGAISSLKLGADGKITDAVIDVGGFLGLGAHSVKMPFSALTVLRQASGSDVRVHLDTTKDKLKAMPHYTV